MKKRSVSYGTILGILLAVIVFVFIIIVSRNIFYSANYAGRWECKFAYAISSPLGLFSQESAVVQQAGNWIVAGVILGTAATLVVGTLITKKYDVKGINYVRVESVSYSSFWTYFERYTLKEAFLTTVKKVFTNQKFLKGLAASAAASGLLYGLASASNSIAENMQKPILEGLCKPKFEGYIDTNDLESSTILEECIKNVKRDIYNISKIEFLNSLDSSNKKLACVLYEISKLVVNTYGETIGANVKVGYGRVHYVLFINYSLDKYIYLSDLIAMLDLLGIDSNKSYYDIIYEKSSAFAKGEGDFYRAYNNFISQKFNKKIYISDKGLPKIVVSCIKMGDNNVGTCGSDDTIILADKGLYGIYIFYDGQGSILINSIK
ncbi:hypothetical protein BA065_00885 [Nanoarchaeota archaeon NZ13-N]|nr:MAG: hypothetical protein BA065_00885 [Nanoarchaeota archaeon NZ13-N]